MESCDDLFQLTQAKVTHIALQATASETDKHPNGREATNTAGLKMKATASRATVRLYSVPVDFRQGSNMFNLLGCPVRYERWGGSADLPQTIRRASKEAGSLTSVGEVALASQAQP
jgi:hypothetical protein